MDKIANAHGGTSDGKARLISTYLEWAGELPRRFYLTSSIVLGWINDDAPHERLSNDMQRRMLTRACDLWNNLKGEQDKRTRQEVRALAA